MSKIVKVSALLDFLCQWGETNNEVNKLQQTLISESVRIMEKVKEHKVINSD